MHKSRRHTLSRSTHSARPGLSTLNEPGQVTWETTRAQTGTPGILVFYSGASTTDAAVTGPAFALANNGGVQTDAAIAQSQLATVYPGFV